MRIVLALTLGLAITGSAQAQTQSFFLHHSDVPVAIPGGTTSSFLDGLAPTATLAIAEKPTVAVGATAIFPTFTAPAFTADTTLLPIASVRLFLSANQKMRQCAAATADLFKLDGAGSPTAIGTGAFSGQTILQGKSEGSIGTDTQLIEFPITDASILTGQGIALATTFTNGCNINRRVFFSYDGLSAPARVRFQCCFTVSAKCAQVKIKTVGNKQDCLLKVAARKASKGEPADPEDVAKCSAKFLAAFDKADSRGGCLTIGDAPVMETLTDAFVADLDGALNPMGPPSKSKCQTAKIKFASKKTKCLLNLEAKAAAAGQFLEPDPVSAQKCRNSFALSFAKLDGKGGCDTTGDAPAIEAKIDAFVDDVTSRLACPCP